MSVRATVDKVRRKVHQSVDQQAALAYRRVFGTAPVPPFDGEPRFALVTVNFSTTRWLKLMLLTLSEQCGLSRVAEIVIVDNGSRDGADVLRRELLTGIPRLRWVQNRRILTHARGMRMGLRALDSGTSAANVVLAIDTDVVFLRQDTLDELSKVFRDGAVLAGQMRHGLYDVPEAQASFVAFRRDVYARPETAPWVDHGAPSFWMQRSIRRQGLQVADFSSYRAGFVLHRGRSGVLAASTHHRTSTYASASNNRPHFMGVPNGELRWQEAEDRWSSYLNPGAESEIAARLAARLS